MISEVNRMIPSKRILLLGAVSLLFVAGVAFNVQSQGPAQARPNPNADFQPMWAVNGMIRWPKSYGVVPVSANLEDSINNRCISFYVAASDPRTGQPIRGDHSQMWKSDEQYRDHYGRPYYVCRYALKLPADRQVRVFASMGSDALLPQADPNPLFLTGAWIGGAGQAKPPAGSMRMFNGSKYAKLDQSNPRATVDFELIYAAPPSDNPR
jgi:hypothetical protein